MAGYFTNNNANLIKLNYIDKVFEAKALLIPGLTIPSDFEVKGEQAYFYSIAGASTTDGDAGRALSTTEGAITRVSLDLKKSYGFSEYISGYAKEDVSEDVGGVKLANALVGMTKLANSTFISLITTTGNYVKATNTTASTKATVYGDIVDVLTEWNEKDENEDRQAKVVIVSHKVAGLLRQCDEFVKGNQGDVDFVREAYIGQVAGLVVLEATLPTNCEFIVMDDTSFLYATGLNKIETIDGIVGRPGCSCIQGELQHGELVYRPNGIYAKFSA